MHDTHPPPPRGPQGIKVFLLAEGTFKGIGEPLLLPERHEREMRRLHLETGREIFCDLRLFAGRTERAFVVIEAVHEGIHAHDAAAALAHPHPDEVGIEADALLHGDEGELCRAAVLRTPHCFDGLDADVLQKVQRNVFARPKVKLLLPARALRREIDEGAVLLRDRDIELRLPVRK